MKTMSRFAPAFACAIAMLIFGLPLQLSAQTATQRIAVIEEFTSATCYPCTTATAVLKPIVLLSNGVIAVRYHLFYPTPGDPFYAANKTDNNARSSFYYGSNPGLPAARVNGHYDVNPQVANQVTDAIKADQAQPYPVKINIVHDKSDVGNVKVNVTVTSDIPLTDYTLQTIVTVHDLLLEKLPLLPDEYTETLEHWNSEKDFSDAMLKMMPSSNGTQVTLAAGESKTFNFTYTPKKSDLWKFDELTIVAFLQNNATQEIIQGATTVAGQVGSMVGTTLSISPSVEPMFVAAMPNETAETKIIIGNVGTSAMQYSGLTITKAPRTPADWKMTTDNFTSDFTIEPGKTKEIMTRLTRGTSIGSGAVEVSFKETGGRTFNSIPITMVAKETEGFLVIDNPTNKNEPFASAIAARTTKKNYVEISASHIRRYSPLFPNFRRMLWNQADSGVVDIKEFSFISTMMNQGISTLISGQRNTYEAAFNGVKAMLDTFGLTYVGPSRVNPFTLTGYAGDTISNGFSESCSITGTYSFYKLMLVKPSKSGVSPFLSVNDTIAAVRFQASNARMIYMGINPGIIQNSTSRNTMLDKAITWLEGSSFTPFAKLSAVDTMDFGTTTSSVSKKLTVTNRGNIPFAVASVNIAGNESSAFSIETPFGTQPIPVGGTNEVLIKFTPIKDLDNSALLNVELTFPEAQPLSVVLKGRKTTSAVDENTSTNSLSLSVQPNPAHESINISYSIRENRSARLRLIDVLGHTLKNIELGTLTIGSYSAIISTENVANGMYYVELSTENDTIKIPAVVAH
jgi:hypothetical protein